MALDRSRGPTSLENPQAGSGSPTNRRLSAVSASSAVLNVPFSEVSHIDSKVSLRFMLKLRGGQQEWQKQGLNSASQPSAPCYPYRSRRASVCAQLCRAVCAGVRMQLPHALSDT